MSTSGAAHKLKLILQNMDLKNVSLQDMRIASEGSFGPQEFWSAPGLPRGVPRGVVVELLGAARIEWFLEFLKMNSELNIFWAEKEQRILPTALQQRGVDLRRVSFGLFPENMLSPLRKVIQSQVFEVVLAPNAWTEVKVFKAFQLFSEKSKSTLFLLGEKEASKAWPISLQLDIQRVRLNTQGDSNSQKFVIEVLRQKHGQEHDQKGGVFL